MIATETLRQLLDERGVEWRGSSPNETVVDAPIDVLYVELPDGDMRAFIRSYLTPEQAVDATLGRGTCRMELPDLRGPAYTDVYVCSECGGEVMVGTVMGVSDVPKWCPWCGREVVES